MKKENPLDEVFGMWKDRPMRKLASDLTFISEMFSGAKITIEVSALEYHEIQDELRRYFSVTQQLNTLRDWQVDIFTAIFNTTEFTFKKKQ